MNKTNKIILATFSVLFFCLFSIQMLSVVSGDRRVLGTRTKYLAGSVCEYGESKCCTLSTGMGVQKCLSTGAGWSNCVACPYGRCASGQCIYPTPSPATPTPTITSSLSCANLYAFYQQHCSSQPTNTPTSTRAPTNTVTPRISCSSTRHCPTGYTCSSQGACIR